MEQNNRYIRLAADLETDSIVNGPGLRAVLWTQGCGHHCEGCQNEQTWDFEGGGLVPIDAVLEEIDKLEYQSGLTISGGDPMYQPEACNEIAEYAKNKGLNIWVYTGFTYEEVMKMAEKKPIYREFLEKIDILVDGKFIQSKRNLSLLFRGSSNQRLIDMKETLKTGQVVLLNEYEYNEEEVFERVPMFV